MDYAEVSRLLRGLTAEEVIQASAGGPGQIASPFGGVIEDGLVMPGNLLTVIESGQYNKVPLMVGANESEFSAFAMYLPPLYEGMANYSALIDVTLGNATIDDVLPSEGDKYLLSKTVHYGSQFWRAVMVDELARRAAEHQNDVYVYNFRWGEEDVRPGRFGALYGPAHAVEIPFFHFNTDQMTGGMWLVYSDFNEINRPGRNALSDAMVSYLASFMRTGDPNQRDSQLPAWEPWSNADGGTKAIVFDAGREGTDIDMDREEVSVASVRRALDAEDEGTRAHVMGIIQIMQPYAIYEKGDYVYDPGGN
jgi:para-nitrobenzyl esterase